jgi:hypothetical protein
VYNEGFYKGIMIVPEHKGVKGLPCCKCAACVSGADLRRPSLLAVMDAKPLIKSMLISQGLAAAYAEPVRLVVPSLHFLSLRLTCVSLFALAGERGHLAVRQRVRRRADRSVVPELWRGRVEGSFSL